MLKTYLGKSKPLETIEEHTKKVCDMLKRLRLLYPDALDETGWLKLYYACLYHDFGKHSLAFQKMIINALSRDPKWRQLCSPSFLKSILDALKEEIAAKGLPDEYDLPHGVLSPCALPVEEMREKGLSEEDVIEVCAAIYFHHERDNFPESSKVANKVIESQLAEVLMAQYGRKPFDEYFYVGTEWRKLKKRGKGDACPRSVCISFVCQYPEEDCEKCRSTDCKGADCLRKEYVMIHGLLNRMDYAASAGLATLEQDKRDGAGDEGRTYSERTEEFLLGKGYSHNGMQSYLAAKKSECAVVIAATGSGKTEGALLWGGGNKLFYTLPVRTAINSMYLRIKSTKSIDYKNAAILHSDAFSQYIAEDADTAFAAYSAARQFSAPLTVCTVDQLFKFVFMGSGAECRLATLAYSNVVIDEIQSYSPSIIACLIYGTRLIRRMGGNVLIMTATLPKIVYDEFIRSALGVDCDAPPAFHTDITMRHRMKFLEGNEFSVDEVIETAKSKRVLVIKNTVKEAQKLYDEFVEAGVEPDMLHSQFTRNDRAKRETEILNFAPNERGRTEKCGIWISTQVVEASLDVDFDVLYTDMCAIESLLQRMGRVYRSRNIDHDGFNVFVFNSRVGVGDDEKCVISSEIYDYSVMAVRAFDGQLLIESDELDLKREMMDMVYDPARNVGIRKSEYIDEIHKRIEFLRTTKPHSLDRKTIDEQFRGMHVKNVIPQSEIDRLRKNGRIDAWKREYEQAGDDRIKQKQLWDELASYTISAPVYIESAKLPPIFHEKEDFEVTQCEYSRKAGLRAMSEKQLNKTSQTNLF